MMIKQIEIVSNTTGEILENYKINTYNQLAFLMNSIKKHYLVNRIETSNDINTVWVQD